MACNQIVDIIELKPKLETKLGTELQKEIVVSTYLVMLVLCNWIRN